MGLSFFWVVMFSLMSTLTLIWKKASLVQYLMSQALVISTPPPIQALCMAAMTGLGHYKVMYNTAYSWEMWSTIVR